MHDAPESRQVLVVGLQRPPERIRRAIRSLGFGLSWVRTAREAAAWLGENQAVCLLIVPELPDHPGLRLCRWLKATPRYRPLPVIFLAPHSTPRERVAALQAGASDYLPWDCLPTELLIRLERLCQTRSVSSLPSTPLRVGALVIDPEAYRVTIAGREIEVTLSEFRLLWALAEEPGVVLGRAELAARMRLRPSSTATRAVDSHVRRLRLKLGPFHGLLRTVRGVGFKLDLKACPPMEGAAGGKASSEIGEPANPGAASEGFARTVSRADLEG